MAHFAQINEDNIVERVIVVNNKKLEGYEEPITIEESNQIDILNKLGGVWVQTSYNNNFRGNYAGIGHSYMSEYDIFIQPKPYESWQLNIETSKWEAPIPYPNDGNDYIWSEESLKWMLVQ